MQRGIIEEHLALAEQHVARGAEIVARQQEIVAELERRGHDAFTARTLLGQFAELQALFVADRDRIRKELGS